MVFVLFSLPFGLCCVLAIVICGFLFWFDWVFDCYGIVIVLFASFPSSTMYLFIPISCFCLGETCVFVVIFGC